MEFLILSIPLVQRIKRKPGIYITQDPYGAFSMANRIGFVYKGRIQQIGTPDELVQSPANLFVARFLSEPTINVMEGYVQLVGTRYQLRTDSLTVALNPDQIFFFHPQTEELLNPTAATVFAMH
ncbi:hypothetical protein [Dictyobacter arantiisoli]|uniref:Transport-associated OB type 2 domain-containing protein n=1 Tax=Dictyobacter arantiisoli TaxID=2014874 RepID=A0A5A5TLH4_9CHLR|nr:hypothetical protein [Dictyobacter arantiisoli]GCF12009.1 hypothetical protein KDI_55730 [Dictyobacter arantiisoli]